MTTPPSPVPTKARALRRIVQLISLEALERASSHRSDHTARPLPRSAAEVVDRSWLQAALGRSAPRARVVDAWERGVTVGTTTRVAVELRWDDAGCAAGLPGHAFVKLTSGVAQRLMLGLGGLLHGEPGFYAHVRPLVEIEAPAGFFGAVERRSWHSVVVLEDVAATRGARFRPGAEPMTVAEVEDLLGQIARVHGALWNSPKLTAWPWLRTPATQMQLIDTLIGLADRTGAGFRRARPQIPASLQRRQGDLFEGMRRSMGLLSRGPRTYLHGDLHVANTYVTRDGAAGIADWQVGLQGGWAHDFAYLLTTALEVQARREHERDLLELYLERLRDAGGAPPSPARAWEAYRQATFYPYFAWVYTLGRSRIQPRFQPEHVGRTLIGRITAAIDDLGSLSAVGL